jgi:hypothetical protein
VEGQVVGTPLPADDRLAVAETLYRYALGVDTRDWPLYRAQFADRVRVDFSDLTGVPAADVAADAYVAAVRPLFERLHATHHMMTNPLVDLADGVTARIRMYVQATHLGDPQDPTSVFTVGGCYENDLVRAADRWLLTGVKLSVSWTSGDPSLLAPPSRSSEQGSATSPLMVDTAPPSRSSEQGSATSPGSRPPARP